MTGYFLNENLRWETKKYSIIFSVVCLLIGAITVVYALTISDKVAKWWDSSELNFLWNVYILKKFDNLEEDRVDYLEKSLSAQKDKNSKLYKHLTIILKRNGKF